MMNSAMGTDSYGTGFFLLGSSADFVTDGFDDCSWDEQQQVFRLAPNQQPRVAESDRTVARAGWAASRPMVEDRFGQLGFLSEDRSGFLYALNWSEYQKFRQGDSAATAGPVQATSETGVGETAADVSLEAIVAPAGCQFRDIALGGDGRVALPYSNGLATHGLQLVHLRRRWQRHLDLSFVPRRAQVDHLNRIWVAGDQWLALCEGEPLPQAYQPEPDRFEPEVVNPYDLNQLWQVGLPPNRTLMAMSCDQENLYLLLEHNNTRVQEILVRALSAEKNKTINTWQLDENLPLATDIAVMSSMTLALMVRVPTGDPALDLPVLQLKDDLTSGVLARRYPMETQASLRFVGNSNGPENSPETTYLSELGPRALVPLPQARYLTGGHATLNKTLDAGDYNTVWHRIYIDACIPSGCSLSVSVKPFDDFDEEGSDWHRQPPLVWVPLDSELPFHGGRFSAEKNRSGLFEILLQREKGSVRDIRGRYLKIRIHMEGDGRHSPAVSHMRVYYPRFSWQRQYLPEFFHQQQDVDIGSDSAANGADLRERLLASFEGLMTPVEEKIVSAECWLNPFAVPDNRLDALAQIVGSQMPVSWPVTRKRQWLAMESYLQSAKGTFEGIANALNIATEGAVARGQIVPVENYRLRRVLATILGISLDDEDHPLTLGTSQSGNSIIGETLILSDEDAQDFLALFAPELAETRRQKKAVSQLFDRYAHRLSIVVHEDARQWRKVIEGLLPAIVPAAITTKIIETDLPFVLGLSPLLGIDTYLQKTPAFRTIVLNNTWLGREGLLRNHTALAPAHVHAVPQA